MESNGGDFPSGCGLNIPYVNQPQCNELVAPPVDNANMRVDKSYMEVDASASGNGSELVNISVLQQLIRKLIKSELTGSLEALAAETCKANGIDLSLLLEPKTSETMPQISSNELSGTDNQAVVISDIGSTSDVKISDAKQCLLPDGPVNNSSIGVLGTHPTSKGKILGDFPTNKPKRSTTRIEIPRRRVSAVRKYPPFCGRNAPCPTKEEHLWINLGNKAKSQDVNGVAGLDVKRNFEDMGRPLKQGTAHLQNNLTMGNSSLTQFGKKGRGQEVNNFEAKDVDLKKRKLEELGRKQTTVQSGNSSVEEKASSSTEANIVPKKNLPIHGVQNARVKVLETLALFRVICDELLQKQARNVGTSVKVIRRVDLEARSIIRAKGKEVNTYKQWIGSVPGVEVGDEFLYRAELVTIGVHRLYQSGIDYMKNGSNIIATSIITSEGGYDDDRGNADVLIYSGQGGNITGRYNKTPENQKLEKGNLALKNCISSRTHVRVTRGYKKNETNRRINTRMLTYTYDGLYTVEKYWWDVGPHGIFVYMFELKRVPGQPKVAWKTSEVQG